MAGRHAGQERRGLQVPSRADMSARSTCTAGHSLTPCVWHLSAQGGESKTKSNQVSGRHEWQKRVKARERRTKRRTDTVLARARRAAKQLVGSARLVGRQRLAWGRAGTRGASMWRMERVRKG